METIVARRSIKSYSWALVAGIVVGLVTYRLGVPGGGSLALGLLIAAAPPAFKLVRAAFGQGEVLRIDETGITDHRLKIGPIPWGHVATISRKRNRICLGIADPEALGIKKTLWRRMNQPLGESSEEFNVILRLQDLDVPADKIATAIEEQVSTGNRQ